LIDVHSFLLYNDDYPDCSVSLTRLCALCHGSGSYKDRSLVSIKLERGMRPNDTIAVTVENGHSECVNSTLMTIELIQHDDFELRGDDLHIRQKVHRRFMVQCLAAGG
jgi:DnaJ-class molecular chaperone